MVTFGPRRGVFEEAGQAALDELGGFESLDTVYRSLCALLYNYVPTSGHPGGSISSGRIAQALLFESMEYDLGDPERRDADFVVYAAGHKALGMYALWALRDEVARIGAPDLLPRDEKQRLRLEDLLGFRRNPALRTPIAARLRSKALDGHPTPATPFVKVATGASGVGLGAAVGLAMAARDLYGAGAPRVHVVEGEGGLTPGRVAEALAAAGTAQLENLVVHVDWNQASIDSERVCRDDGKPGDYVQWTPAELFYLHDWNVIPVEDGLDFRQILGAQRKALALRNGQPTAIVYRTVKGWRYGIEGRAAHGAGHKLCSPGFFAAAQPLEAAANAKLPVCESGNPRCAAGALPGVMEECLWQALGIVRTAMERDERLVELLTARLISARARLEHRARRVRADAPDAERIYARVAAPKPLEPGKQTTLRGELARVLSAYDKASGGALMVSAADLLGSTSIGGAGRNFASGGICEDAMSAILSGISAFGSHVGVGASYGAFIAPLGHVAARLHAIGQQARGGPYHPMILVCAHAGLKTGEDGPTHADPQALQVLQENFPRGTAITLTPWEPQEIWPLVTAALGRRPAVLAPFVTRPSEDVLDRAALGLAPAADSVLGLYRLRKGSEGPLLLQGSAVAYAFVQTALPSLLNAGIDLDVWYVSSAELFDALPDFERERLWPEERARSALGITDFTLPTLWRWITSERGRAASLHPFRKGHYLGSGQGPHVLAEAGLDGMSQVEAIRAFIGR